MSGLDQYLKIILHTIRILWSNDAQKIIQSTLKFKKLVKNGFQKNEICKMTGFELRSLTATRDGIWLEF